MFVDRALIPGDGGSHSSVDAGSFVAGVGKLSQFCRRRLLLQGMKALSASGRLGLAPSLLGFSFSFSLFSFRF